VPTGLAPPPRFTPCPSGAAARRSAARGHGRP
jgi:hypothetical protein